VIEFYDAGGGSDANIDPILQPLNLTTEEQAALVSFLESLCGDPIIVTAAELPPYEPWQGTGGN
jgi:cytochrome c peroxidase